MLFRVHLAWAGSELASLVVIDTYSIGSCKSNNHAAMHKHDSPLLLIMQ